MLSNFFLVEVQPVKLVPEAGQDRTIPGRIVTQALEAQDGK